MVVTMSRSANEAEARVVDRNRDLLEMGESLKSSYNDIAQRYRSDDDIEIQTSNHQHFRNILTDLSLSFARPIRVLDLGCGTGRYFHCIQNAEELVGVDISDAMLELARNPVMREAITAKSIQLL